MAENSETIEARLCAYVEGSLDEAERAEIERHLELHPNHRRLLAELAAQRDWLQHLPREEAPADLAEAIESRSERAALLDAGTRSTSAARWSTFGPRTWLAAAVVILAAGLGVLVYVTVPTRQAARRYSMGPTSSERLATQPRGDEETRPELLSETTPPAPDATPPRPAEPAIADRESIKRGVSLEMPRPERAPLPSAATPTPMASVEPDRVVLVVQAQDLQAAHGQVLAFFSRNNLEWNDATELTLAEAPTTQEASQQQDVPSSQPSTARARNGYGGYGGGYGAYGGGYGRANGGAYGGGYNMPGRPGGYGAYGGSGPQTRPGNAVTQPAGRFGDGLNRMPATRPAARSAGGYPATTATATAPADTPGAMPPINRAAYQSMMTRRQVVDLRNALTHASPARQEVQAYGSGVGVESAANQAFDLHDKREESGVPALNAAVNPGQSAQADLTTRPAPPDSASYSNRSVEIPRSPVVSKQAGSNAAVDPSGMTSAGGGLDVQPATNAAPAGLAAEDDKPLEVVVVIEPPTDTAEPAALTSLPASAPASPAASTPPAATTRPTGAGR